MQTNPDQVEFFREDMRGGLRRELAAHQGSYELWYKELHEVRRFFYRIAIEKNPTFLKPYMVGRHRLDQHVYGYFAPLDFFRKGFGGEIYTPAQQLADLSRQFADHGIRFVYVALPCKKAVYPEIVLPQSLLPQDGNIIPHWRKMISDIVDTGVEVVDLYPYFRHYRDQNRLFSYGHDISAVGASLIASVVSTYLSETTQGIPTTYAGYFSSEDAEVDEDERKLETSQTLFRSKVYTGEELCSEIGVFGNCNLQKYRMSGVDITAQIALGLQYPVNFLGRLLPFSCDEGLDRAPKGLFRNKKLVLYVGFPSASFVRSVQFPLTWTVNRIPEESFF